MILGVGNDICSNCEVVFGTHNGIFHVDEVVGIAILEITLCNCEAYVVRTRNLDILREADFVLDVGGGKFDHHVKGFCKRRQTGELYASAGLVWKAYGKWAINSVIARERISLEYDEVLSILEEIDREIIIPVDLEDNGVSTSSHTFSFVTKFLPSWMETPHYDDCFYKVEQIVSGILYQIIKDKAVAAVTRRELATRLSLVDDGILEIPSQTMPWTDVVIEHNQTHNYGVKFVIFPYPAGGWAAQCVPPSMDNKFGQLVPFPKEWAGADASTLPQLSGVSDATFCHNGCFFARANSKEGVIELCRIAMK